MFGMPYSAAPYSSRFKPPAGDVPKAPEAACTETTAAAAASAPGDADAPPETPQKEKL
jgi:hypothetical protein